MKSKERLVHISCNLAEDLDIITLSETWLATNNSDSDFTLNNFQGPFRRDRDFGHLGNGGVLAWVKNTIACKHRRNLEVANIEALWLEIRTYNTKFFLCVL